MNHFIKFLILGCFLLIPLCLLIIYPNRITFTTESFSEGTEPLANPYQGFYHIIGYTLSDDDTPENTSALRISSPFRRAQRRFGGDARFPAHHVQVPEHRQGVPERRGWNLFARHGERPCVSLDARNDDYCRLRLRPAGPGAA